MAPFGRAERAAAAPFPALPATLFLDFLRSRTRANYEDAHFTRRRMIAAVELNLLLRDQPTADPDAGTLRYGDGVITFEPRPARLDVAPVSLDDPTLASNRDRQERWRATATYAEAPAGSARTTVARTR